jgi:hypothetical protein
MGGARRMERQRPARNCRFAIVVLLEVVVAFHSAPAQQVRPPSLDEILLGLDSNLHHYDAQIPNFFCNEHVTSVIVYGKNHQSTVTDSIFRLKHSTGSGEAGTFTESREVKAINGTPADGKNISGPSILSGVFSGGLNTVSLGQKSCMSYALQPIKPGHRDEPYVVQFATLPGDQHTEGCVLKEEGAGRVFIDPATMQVKRMELTVPRHAILPAVTGVWHVSIDYSPVQLGGQTFWMPASITSRATPENVRDHTIWWFNARYTAYHKLEVTSRILPSVGSSQP